MGVRGRRCGAMTDRDGTPSWSSRRRPGPNVNVTGNLDPGASLTLARDDAFVSNRGHIRTRSWTNASHSRHRLAVVEQQISAHQAIDHPDGSDDPYRKGDGNADEDQPQRDQDQATDHSPQQGKPEGADQPAVMRCEPSA